jgi:hypothetical protein
MVNQLDMKLQHAWRFEQRSPGLFQTSMDPSYLYSPQEMGDDKSDQMVRIIAIMRQVNKQKASQKKQQRPQSIWAVSLALGHPND